MKNTVSKYDERSYALKVESDGFQTNRVRYELELLVKLWSERDYSKSEIEKILKGFCEVHHHNFSYTRDFKLIESAIRKGYNERLRVATTVDITLGELMAIDELQLDDTKSKILLALIFKIKLIKLFQDDPSPIVDWYFGGNYRKYGEIKRISKISSRQNIHIHIYEMKQAGIIKSMLNGVIKLLFLDDNSLLENDSIFYEVDITNYENIGLLWDIYKGRKKINLCQVCGKLISPKHPKQKYCKVCAVVVNREKTRLRKQTKIEKFDLETPMKAL